MKDLYSLISYDGEETKDFKDPIIKQAKIGGKIYYPKFFIVGEGMGPSEYECMRYGGGVSYVFVIESKLAVIITTPYYGYEACPAEPGNKSYKIKPNKTDALDAVKLIEGIEFI